MQQVTMDDFLESFGATASDFSQNCLDLIDKGDFTYRSLTSEERDGIILEVLRKVKSDNQIIAAPERQLVWNQGWSENLDAFKISGYDLSALVPKFIRENKPIRFRGDYILPNNPSFEYDYMTVFRTWLFQKFFSDVESIYEFGCGTGLNLVLLAETMGIRDLHGLDFVPSAVELINSIGDNCPWNIKGHLFDMITPDKDFELRQAAGVLTFGALEQLASQFENFIQYLLQQKPARVVHVEPTIELYDENSLFDYLAIEFHRKRGYSENLLTHLQEMERQKKIRILKTKRLFFGSLFMEGYTYMAWEPL